jgi:hypothetical protein
MFRSNEVFWVCDEKFLHPCTLKYASASQTKTSIQRENIVDPPFSNLGSFGKQNNDGEMGFPFIDFAKAFVVCNTQISLIFLVLLM